MNDIESTIEEIKQITNQYRAEVGQGRKAWPRSIKDRVSRLSAAGLKATAIAKRTGIPYDSVLKWRPKDKLRPRGKSFRELLVVESAGGSQKLGTVTVPSSQFAVPEKLGTVTVTTPDGYRVEMSNEKSALEIISALRRLSDGVSSCS